MAVKLKFQPHDYAEHLERTGNWCHDHSSLYHWNDTYWERVAPDDAMRMAYGWLCKHKPEHLSPENAKRAVLAAGLHLPPLPIAPNVPEIVLPCRNGYLHLPLVPGEPPVWKSPDKSIGIRYGLTVKYDPAATGTIHFAPFLEKALPWSEVRERVQEYVGYTLIPDARFQRAQFWIGEGANGKGVLSKVVQKLHGSVATASLANLSGFNLAGIVDASFVCVDEVPNTPSHEQLVKRLIAGEIVQVERKYENPFSTRIQAKWIVLGNANPVVQDHSSGFWRRIDIVPFGPTVPENERDPMLTEKIVLNELSAVLNWAIEGLQRLLTRNGFSTPLPPQMQAMLDNAKHETNSILAWMQHVELVTLPGGDTPTRKTALYAEYRQWCAQGGLKPESSNNWWKQMVRSFSNKLELKRRRGGPGENPDNFCNLIHADKLPA